MLLFNYLKERQITFWTNTTKLTPLERIASFICNFSPLTFSSCNFWVKTNFRNWRVLGTKCNFENVGFISYVIPNEIMGLFGFLVSITHNSVSITHNSKTMRPMTQKLVWISITLFSVFVSITQFFDFWVMSYGNCKHTLAVFSFHNFIFNDIFVIKHTWRDPLVRSTAHFNPFFSFLLHCSSIVLSSFIFFFSSFSPLSVQFFFFFCSSSHNIFGLRWLGSFFLFSSSFTSLRWLGFSFFFLLLSLVSAG